MASNFSGLVFHNLGTASVLTALIAFCQIAGAQERIPPEIHSVVPAIAERFVVASDLMIPWARSDGICDGLTPNPKPNCHTIRVTEWDVSHFLTIYNSDGTIWHQFSVKAQDPAFFLRSPKSSFKPLGPVGETRPGEVVDSQIVVLRLVRESPSWHEVEINEQTRETRFILKSDPLWTKVSWGDIFNMGFNVLIDPTRTNILDSPNGSVIKECAEKGSSKHVFTRLEGDWMMVNGRFPADETCKGWIRWRNGRTILVGVERMGWKVHRKKGAETTQLEHY